MVSERGTDLLSDVEVDLRLAVAQHMQVAV
jgi:hypothetical protein